ncbi:hypothetical protein HYDPIDRAFT_164780 [Hydnomerulius pinastri MD-312]|nr:hypothetical protein HYDPIDRAFT_164780 [Hydnomerulius pinastri MD-312]
MTVLFRLYVVRHGETEWNKTRRIQGQIDVPLNEMGIEQAGLVAKALKDVPFVKAYTSDLQRASKTAEAIIQYHPSVVLERDQAIRERLIAEPAPLSSPRKQHMGELQGELGGWGRKPAPSLETTPALIQRCQAWYSRSIAGYMLSRIKEGLPDRKPQNILVVSHGGWIAVLLSSLTANNVVTCAEGITIGHHLNTGVSIIEYAVEATGKERSLVGHLVQYSDVSHLVHEDMRRQEATADVLVDQGRIPE